ncbi:hypothetical protein [Aeoliella sp.]|uniref:hypothetical protein n=1 Tax=Aeoliella sp. TaxID=2795800 RepID=UPI003CCBCF17
MKFLPATALSIAALGMLVAGLSADGQTQTQPPPQAPPYAGSEPAQTNTYVGGGWGGYGGGYHSSTAAGDALQGMASAISAQGSKNLNDSLALRNVEEARSANIDNRAKHVEEYRWRKDSAVARQQQQLAEMHAESMKRLEKKRLQPLTVDQYNPTTGVVHWPMLCADPAYKEHREKIDQLLATRAHYGELNMEQFMQLENEIKEFRYAITADRKKYPKPPVDQALRFLLSMHKDLNAQFG